MGRVHRIEPRRRAPGRRRTRSGSSTTSRPASGRTSRPTPNCSRATSDDDAAVRGGASPASRWSSTRPRTGRCSLGRAPAATDIANTHGTLSVLHAAHQAGVRRVVTASSSSVYGGADVMPTPETEPLIPRSPYAVSQAGRRALLPGLRRALRARDGGPALLQRLRPPAAARLAPTPR